MPTRKSRRLRFVAHALRTIPRVSEMTYGSANSRTVLTASVSKRAAQMNSTGRA